MQIRFIALALVLAAPAAQAQVFKCVDGQGKVTFSQTPCAGQAAEKIEVKNNEIGGQFATRDQVDDHHQRRADEKEAREVGRRQAERTAQRQQEPCLPFSDQDVRTMVIRHQVVPGMKMSDVFKAWGRPDQITGRQHVWWFGTVTGSFVYAENGCVESVSGRGYRGSKFVR